MSINTVIIVCIDCPLDDIRRQVVLYKQVLSPRHGMSSYLPYIIIVKSFVQLPLKTCHLFRKFSQNWLAPFCSLNIFFFSDRVKPMLALL